MPFPLTIYAVNRLFSQGLKDVLEKSITESIAICKDSVTIFYSLFTIHCFECIKTMKTLTKEIQAAITPTMALGLLKEGNKRFVNNLKVNRNLLQNKFVIQKDSRVSRVTLSLNRPTHW